MFKLYNPSMILSMPDGDLYYYETVQRVLPELADMRNKYVLEGTECGDHFVVKSYEKLDILLTMFDVDGDLASSGLPTEEIVNRLNEHLMRDPITKYDLTMSILKLHEEISDLKECIEKCIGAVCMVHADIEAQQGTL